MITNLVVNNINFSLNKTMRAKSVNNTDIEVMFRMTIPAYINDKDLIKNENHSVMYMSSKKLGTDRFSVTIKNMNDSYPRVSNNKCLCIKRRYNIIDWITSNSNYFDLLCKDRELAFRELKSNIILENIGELTKKWNASIEGSYYEDNRPAYGYRQYITGDNYLVKESKTLIEF